MCCLSSTRSATTGCCGHAIACSCAARIRSCARSGRRGPLVWHIYPQAANAHGPKLEAFLERYCGRPAGDGGLRVRDLWLAWNGVVEGADVAAAWSAFLRHRDLLAAHAEGWAQTLAAQGDLAANLVEFCRNRLK